MSYAFIIRPDAYKAFEDEAAQLAACKEWGLLSEKAAKAKIFYYRGHGLNEPCAIVGYVDKMTAVIELGGQERHCIHPSYLKEMQAANFGQRAAAADAAGAAEGTAAADAGASVAAESADTDTEQAADAAGADVAAESAGADKAAVEAADSAEASAPGTAADRAAEAAAALAVEAAEQAAVEPAPGGAAAAAEAEAPAAAEPAAEAPPTAADGDAADGSGTAAAEAEDAPPWEVDLFAEPLPVEAPAKKARKDKPGKLQLPEDKVRMTATVREFTTVPNNFSDNDDEVVIYDAVSILEPETAIGEAWSSHSATLKKLELAVGDVITFEAKIIAKKLAKHPVAYKINNPSKIAKA